jgi:hypothetical protein
VLRLTSGSISKKQAERTISPGLFFCFWSGPPKQKKERTTVDSGGGEAPTSATQPNA